MADKEDKSTCGLGWNVRFRSLFENLPPDYGGCYSTVTEMQHAFRANAAACLQDRLNDHLKTMPQNTLAEKQELAGWVNEQLRLLDLAVQCPKSSLPGILLADCRDSKHEEVTRFRVKVFDERRGRYLSYSSSRLFDLNLIEKSPRQEPLSHTSRKQRDQGSQR